jgi:hypothetical protein
MDLIPLNLKRDTVCDAGEASTSRSGRGDLKGEFWNMMVGEGSGVVELSSRDPLYQMRSVGQTRCCV